MGPNHTHAHRMCFGTMLLLIGVSITQFEAHGLIRFVCDAFGYSLHGLGFTPFVELLQKNGEGNKNE